MSTRSSDDGSGSPAAAPGMRRAAATSTMSRRIWRHPVRGKRKSEYEVGYRKPPVHTRFKSGKSGNPRGRPRASKNLSTLLNEALNESVAVVENGRRRKISKRQAIIAQL